MGSYVSELERRHAIPSQAQRNILAGLASVVGGLSAPYEKASHVHERPVVNWLLAAGCHSFGPFSNTCFGMLHWYTYHTWLIFIFHFIIPDEVPQIWLYNNYRIISCKNFPYCLI